MEYRYWLVNLLCMCMVRKCNFTFSALKSMSDIFKLSTIRVSPAGAGAHAQLWPAAVLPHLHVHHVPDLVGPLQLPLPRLQAQD
jgi:hypothetical protein